jgi:hypothetical protein
MLFGGLVGQEINGDTWVRENGQWRMLPITGPSPRNVHAMGYDVRRQRVVLYGGIGAEGRMDDLWEWDGEDWLQVY